jgi:hypothetical protein
MKPISLVFIGSILLCLVACKFKTDLKINPVSGKIRNGIQLKPNGLYPTQAFLLDEKESLIEDDNLVKPNEYLNLRLVIDSGWIVNNGLVKIGAAEKVETSDGEVLLDEKDLFAAGDEVNASDAKVITLKVIITKVTKLYDYYLVTFRVWDKNGTGEVTGSYKFHLQ